MKKSMLACLFATTCLTPAFADEIIANSNIDAVTVFPLGAEVTRLATVETKSGAHTLVLKGLPDDIDPQSIRVSGRADTRLEIRSIDSAVNFITSDQTLSLERKRIEADIQKLQDKITAFNQQSKTLGYQRKLIQDAAIRPIKITAPDDTQIENPKTDLGELFDLVAERLQALDEKSLQIQINTRNAQMKINDLNLKLGELSPKQTASVDITIAYQSEKETTAAFEVKYRVHNGRWQPFYDARLEIGEKNEAAEIQLVRRAEIIQNTTEIWNDVAITLSTARSYGSTSAPQLEPVEFAAVYQPRPITSREKRISDLSSAVTQYKPVMEDEAVMAEKSRDEFSEIDAQIFTAGFQATYKIDGRFTVENHGTAKKVRMASETVAASLSVHSAPSIDLNAYLTASFRPKGEHPLLPGRVILFRDHVYMGQGYVPLIASGEEHELGFGVDDQVRIKRSKAKRKTGESGILTTARTEENSWITEIKNLHDREMIVKIYDRMPYAVHEDTQILLLHDTTKPTERNIENKQGIFAWEYDLEPGDEATIKFGYRITHPQS